MLTLANPPMTILGAWLLFDETLVPLQILGGVIVLGSLGFIVKGQRGARALAAEAALGWRPSRRDGGLRDRVI